jgi:hypothetical protein
MRGRQNGGMIRRLLPSLAAGLATIAAVAASGARAADSPTVLAADPAAQQVAALDGAAVWVSGKYPTQVLMQQTPVGPARVPGAPAGVYRGIDLGHDKDSKLILTYLRCDRHGACVTLKDDLHGHRASFRGLALPGCSVSSAPAVWRTRVAYGLFCRKGKFEDPKRSGLYVKSSTGSPKRLPLPKDAEKFHITGIDRVDLRGTRVAAVAADIYSYAFSESVSGTGIRSFLAAASEGDSDEHVVGLALGTGGVAWTLVDAEHAGDPNLAVISRLDGACQEYEQLANDPRPLQEEGYRATGLAVDGQTIALVLPGTGIVTHSFTAQRPCA